MRRLQRSRQQGAEKIFAEKQSGAKTDRQQLAIEAATMLGQPFLKRRAFHV